MDINEDRPWEYIEGFYEIRFLNGDKIFPQIKANIVNSYGHPLYLIDVNGVIFNWMTIISIKKVD